MDPITMAIVAALAKLSETVIADGYQALKAVIARKFGASSDLATAVESVEQKPESEGRQATLSEEVAAAKADQDPELRQAAEALLARLKEVPPGQTVVEQTVTGDKNIFSGTGDITVGDPPR